MKTILMSKENPTGYKLEELLTQLINEIKDKNAKIINDNSDLSKLVQNNNLKIVFSLNDALNAQRHSFLQMSKKAPDDGPNGKPRIGGE